MPDDHDRMVHRSARPSRTAVLMLAPEQGWEGTAAGVLGSLSLTWGGAGDIVVPVTGDGPHPAFGPVVRAFDPDWVSSYTTTCSDLPDLGDGSFWMAEVPPADVAAVAGWCSPFPGTSGFHPFTSRGRAVQYPLVPLQGFPDAWEGGAADLDLSQVDPLLALMVTMRIGTLADATDLPSDRKPVLLAARQEDVPALTELALTGAARTRSAPAGSEIRHMRGLHAGAALPAVPRVSPVQPLERTTHGMARLRPFLGRPVPWIVVVGDTCADFCLALACDRLLGGATWLPLSRLPGQVLDTGFPALSRRITSAATMNGMLVPVTSASLDAGQLEETREQLRGRGGAAFTDAHTTVIACGDLDFAWPARLGDPAQLALAETSAVHRDPSDGSLRIDSALMTPVPAVVQRASAGNVTWAVDVRVEGEQPPARPALGPGDLLAVVPGAQDLQIRAGAGSLVYHSRSALVTFAGASVEMSLARPRLRIPAVADILGKLAEAAGYDIRPSQTGRLNATLASLWGGYPQAAADLCGPMWQLLAGLVPAGGQDGNKNGRLVVHGLPYVTFGQAASLLGMPAPQTREILDRLLRLRILRRGLVLRCGRCNWLSWYSLESLGQDFECQRCTHANLIEQQLWRDPLEEPAWYYDMDHAVREALRLGGRVPILAAASLARQHASAFSLTPDFELIRPGVDKPTAEIDLGVIGDGKIILCEAKSSGMLDKVEEEERRAAGKLITACRALTADVLCLATSHPTWSDRTRATVAAACSQAGIRPLWLEGLGVVSNRIAAGG